MKNTFSIFNILSFTCDDFSSVQYTLAVELLFISRWHEIHNQTFPEQFHTLRNIKLFYSTLFVTYWMIQVDEQEVGTWNRLGMRLIQTIIPTRYPVQEVAVQVQIPSIAELWQTQNVCATMSTPKTTNISCRSTMGGLREAQAWETNRTVNTEDLRAEMPGSMSSCSTASRWVLWWRAAHTLPSLMTCRWRSC